MDNSTACAKRSAAKRPTAGEPLRGSPDQVGLLPIKWMACGHAFFEARRLPRSGAPPPQPEPAPVRHKDHENQQPRQESNTGPAFGRYRGTEGRHLPPVLIDGSEYGLSVPDRQAGRHGRKRPRPCGALRPGHHARPTSRPPAQPGACARHAGTVRGDREAVKPFSRKKAGQRRAKNRRQGQQEGPGRFSGAR